MMGHLGSRVSALVDGQLSAAEAEDAWAHVYGCHACRDLVEREGWIKTRLAGLSQDTGCASPASHSLKGSLMDLTPHRAFVPAMPGPSPRRVNLGVVVVGGSALGAALLGVVALGLAPGSSAPDRRPPASEIGNVAPTGAATQRPSPAGRTGRAVSDGAEIASVFARAFR